jgi:hypothetical protein
MTDEPMRQADVARRKEPQSDASQNTGDRGAPRGWLGSSMLPESERGMVRNDRRAHASGRCGAPIVEYGEGPPMRGKDPSRAPLPAGGRQGTGKVPNARRG